MSVVTSAFGLKKKNIAKEKNVKKCGDPKMLINRFRIQQDNIIKFC